MSTSIAVCVTGMPRSGIALTSRVLDLLGMSLGAQETPAAARVEQQSCESVEHAALTEISDRLLGAFGGSWSAPPELPPEWQASPAVAPLRRQARAALRATLGREQPWGWNDPRAALTLPFWQRFVPDARYVLCIRNPLDVAASLAARDGLPARDSHELWFRYAREAILNTAGRTRVFICFEDYFDHPEAQIKRLTGVIGSRRGPAQPAVRDAVDAFLDADLAHHRASLVDALDDPEVPLAVKSLYLTLVASTRPPGGAVSTWLGANLVGEPLDALARDLQSPGQASAAGSDFFTDSSDGRAPRVSAPLPTIDVT